MNEEWWAWCLMTDWIWLMPWQEIKLPTLPSLLFLVRWLVAGEARTSFPWQHPRHRHAHRSRLESDSCNSHNSHIADLSTILWQHVGDFCGRWSFCGVLLEPILMEECFRFLWWRVNTHCDRVPGDSMFAHTFSSAAQGDSRTPFFDGIYTYIIYI